MTDIPSTARGFARWYKRSEHEWPIELQRLGMTAVQSLNSLDDMQRLGSSLTPMRRGEGNDRSGRCPR